jgi:hypothetical protein
VSPFRSRPRSTLYRTARWRVIYGVVALAVFLQTGFPAALEAQITRPPKTSKGPRALGLLELAPNGKAHLIPITIMIDGKYYDASAYKADPVPMALWSETVYEAVRTGVSMGLFTVTGALQRKEGDATEWMAEGTWQTASSIKAKAAKKTMPSVPRGMNDDEGPPVLRRAGSKNPKPPEPPSAPATPAQPQAAASASTATAPPATTQPPAATTASTPAASATASQEPPPQADKPPEDKDRPALKRGKAGAESAAEAEKNVTLDSSTKPTGHGTAPSPASPTASSSAAQRASQIQLIPAISDSDGPDPLPYTYNLKPEEEQQFRKKMLAIAAEEVRARAAELGSASAGTTRTRASSQHGKATAVKAPQPTFSNVQLRIFDLADINEPELVLTAAASMPQRPHEKENSELQYMITLVVREDVNGELHKSLVNITDTQHLDVIPQLELIDAVDVDGDGRAELLFREVSDTASAFVVYRVIGDRLYPLFQGALGS